ncbi:MAG: c-type cytochrome [Rhodospirillales bacterium]|nr:c-type cytochrome [Rhodospirillales bacterium]
MPRHAPALAVPFVLLALALPNAARAADPAAGKAVFQQQCAICHADKPGVNKIGPTLFGVVGRHTGEVPGYSYSVANKNANIVWTPDVLDRYLAHPQSVVPGTKMPYAGLANATKRADLIAFLATLKAPGAVASAAAPGTHG